MTMRPPPKVVLKDVDWDNNAMEPVVFGHSSVHWWPINERFPDEHILVHAMGFVNRYMTRFRGPGNGRKLIELYRMTLDMSRGEKFDEARKRTLSLKAKQVEEDEEDVKSVFRSFIQEMYEPDDRTHIVEYLKGWTNHQKIDVEKYSTRLKFLNDWVQWMPGDQES